ncbi:MAG: malto-oligosyltrehalose synthase [Deinococcota bacterium]|nr:malto-oligosyltrehalose synthase [Deinococcota bacterium]
MNASYRLQLHPGFDFEAAREVLPYLRRLGISHLYLSPITDARRGSTHGYDVVHHNLVREELGGLAGFERLREAAVANGLEIILDFVPNHAGVGPRNVAWQDVLAYGPHSRYARYFDIDWTPLKPELTNKLLLPFLGSPYGEVLDGGELGLVFERGGFYLAYHGARFALSPASYALILEAALSDFERTEAYWDLKDLQGAYSSLEPQELEKAEALGLRLTALASRIDLEPVLASLGGERLHHLLEEQFWRLASWKTAGFEINYRRFFDINELMGLRMEEPEVFWDAHRLLAELLAKEGVRGVRIDHIDGLFDPHSYLAWLKDAGARSVWVEKILAHGEILPEAWPVEGSTGYEFMNDAMNVLLWPQGEPALDRIYRRSVREARDYGDEVHRAKRLVMETALSGELFRLAYSLDRISESDYRTRDFTLEGLREALSEVVASFSRYRTYLPHDRDEAEGVIKAAIHEARRRNPATEPTVYDFIVRVLLDEVKEELEEARAAWVGRFQQYTAPLAAKGVEDTTFYRFVRLAALNEVGGEPDHFGVTAQAFHAHARFRAFRYPNNLLATATHDHKRGEDTRMRLIALAELNEAWQELVEGLSARARGRHVEKAPSDGDIYLFYQVLVALWEGADRDSLSERLLAYMHKASRESKGQTSWLNPDEAYEGALERFVRDSLEDPELPAIVGPLARDLARYGFHNTLSQLALKLTSPGVPDLYQGTELLDLSLVDPDNRREVDYGARAALLDGFEGLLQRPDADAVRAMLEAGQEGLKLYLTARLLRFRSEHPSLFGESYQADGYQPLEAEGEEAEHVIAYLRAGEAGAMLVVVTRFPAELERRGGFTDTRLPLPEGYRGRDWQELLSGQTLPLEAALELSRLPLPWAVLYSAAPANDAQAARTSPDD